MKLFICSDLHGSAYYCKKLITAYEKEGADKILFLGDMLYHGPRNDLPLEYSPKMVCKLMNEMKDELLCVKGNCDADVDQMILDFPIMASYCFLNIDGINFLATHGDIMNENNCSILKPGDILLHGHTHVSECIANDKFIYINPGSVSIPKNGTPNSYLIYQDGLFLWKDIDGNNYKEFSL